MTILTKALSAIGLMRVPETQADDITEYAADLKRANEARDNWRDSSKEREEKWRAAVIGSEKDAREISRLAALIECRDAEIADLRPDAEQMRRKRAGDRNRVRKPRDKRAKNRGGDRG